MYFNSLLKQGYKINTFLHTNVYELATMNLNVKQIYNKKLTKRQNITNRAKAFCARNLEKYIWNILTDECKFSTAIDFEQFINNQINFDTIIIGTMDDNREESQFIVDDVSKIIKEAIENTIGGNAYQHDKVNNWTGQVVENCLSVLTKEQKPYKYIVTSMIMQKNGAGLHTASSCYWNNDTDGSCTVRWENKTMYCIVSVFGLAV